MSALYRTRHGETKFIDLPICLTVHERIRYMNSGHVMRPEPPSMSAREFDGKIRNTCERVKIKVIDGIDETQSFRIGDLSFGFPAFCTTKKISIYVNHISSPDPTLLQTAGCVYLFQTSGGHNNEALTDMPTVVYTRDPTARLYTWIPSTSYWFRSSAGLPMIDGIHAFVRHVDIFPPPLILPGDMFIQKTAGQPFIRSDYPVQCYRLQVREHDTKKFPNKAYHGTHIDVISSILMDGFVMPSTVVSTGFRVCPPPGHIARGIENFGIKDFANAIFLSPSVHYSSDPVYAVAFQVGDQVLFPVLECGVKNGTFRTFPSTVTKYIPHADDDIQALEWRLVNPGDIQIISVLFIEKISSRTKAVKRRADNLGVDLDAIAQHFR